MNWEVSRIRAPEGEARNAQRLVAQVGQRDSLWGAMRPRVLWAEAGDVAGGCTAVPVPLKLTVCGLLGSLSAMTRVADRTPAAVGLNAKLIVQRR